MTSWRPAGDRAALRGRDTEQLEIGQLLIEAAVRSRSTRTAEEAMDRLAETTQAGGTEDGLGIEARSRALLRSGDEAEAHYREAISHLGGAQRRPELARAHLLYGEWLRRERRSSACGRSSTT